MTNILILYIVIFFFTSSQAFLYASNSLQYCSRPLLRVGLYDYVRLPYENNPIASQSSRFIQQRQEEVLPTSTNWELLVPIINRFIVIFSIVWITHFYIGTAAVAAAADSESTISTFSTHSTSITSSLSTTQDIFSSSLQKAIGGGKAGALAAVVQVFSLMWLRTAMNYQYRFGGTLSATLSTLWSQGGIGRFYQGLPFALIQGPFSRFGDTFSNVGSLALLQQIVSLLTSETAHATQDPNSSNALILAGFLSSLPVKTAFGSMTAALFRILLMPIDTCKTVMQVDGAEGLQRLFEKIKQSKSINLLYQGSLASAAATAVGHFPWFLTYNYLNDILPSDQIMVNSIFTIITPMLRSVNDVTQLQSFISLSRSAIIGFVASCVSDTSSNSLRVIKTTKQTAAMDSGKETTASGGEISYSDAIKMIVQKDGIVGLFGRGLQTRLLTNALQGAAFSVLWRYFQQL